MIGACVCSNVGLLVCVRVSMCDLSDMCPCLFELVRLRVCTGGLVSCYVPVFAFDYEFCACVPMRWPSMAVSVRL